MIERFTTLVAASSSEIPQIRTAVRNLVKAWLRANREPVALIDSLFLTAEYVDNEFYRRLRLGKADPRHVSVLHLRSYNDSLRVEFEKSVAGLLEFSEGQTVYRFATQVAEQVMPLFAEVYPENPSTAYLSSYSLIRDFIDLLQRARRSLPKSRRSRG
jgi:hypothetical protein